MRAAALNGEIVWHKQRRCRRSSNLAITDSWQYCKHTLSMIGDERNDNDDDDDIEREGEILSQIANWARRNRSTDDFDGGGGSGGGGGGGGGGELVIPLLTVVVI